jgi:hypothetical protein
MPEQPSTQIDDGMFIVSITATNPNSFPILVAPDALFSRRGFFFQMYGPGTGVTQADEIWDSTLRSFRSGETKRTYFDVSLRNAPGAIPIAPGEYTVAGGFEGAYLIGPSVVLTK